MPCKRAIAIIGSALLLILTSNALLAQESPPLTGPVLAINTVEQDRIILYDVGSDRYRLLELGAGAHHAWDFSPDGCRLLATLHEGQSRVITSDLRGGDVRQMVQVDNLTPDQWSAWAPDWHPTGDRIAFIIMRDRLEEPEYHLAVVTPGQPAPQLYSVSGTEAAPQWSPDGNWLAYISYEERVAGANVFATAAPTAEPLAGQTPQFAPTVDEADIWIVDPAGQTKYPLTRFDTGSATRPRWSPDSDLISFVYSPSPGNDMIWMIANQPQAFATQLTLQWSLALDHTWLPDSSHIIASLRDFNEQSANQLWQMPLVGGDDANIIAYREELEIAHADFPRFSPDGHWLAVRSAYELWLINLESGEQRALDPITFGNSPAVWSPAAFEGEAAC